MSFESNISYENFAKVKVVGVGGAGGNAVNRMIEVGLSGVDFIAVNTDAQDLESSKAAHKVLIGSRLTRGLGAGADPEIGRKAIEEDRELVARSLVGANMVFIIAGMGGGTGTGAAPLVAQIAKEQGALTVAVVTEPYHFEGKKRMNRALMGIEKLKNSADTLIVITNEELLSKASPDTKLTQAFELSDEEIAKIVSKAVATLITDIANLMTVPGLINLDFADVKAVMAQRGDALFGLGHGSGEEAARKATTQAISGLRRGTIPLEGARGVLINITGGKSMSLPQVNEVARLITEAVGAEANIVFGAVVDETLGDEIRVTVIASAPGKPVKIRDETRVEMPERPRKTISFELDDLDIPTFIRKGAGSTKLDEEK